MEAVCLQCPEGEKRFARCRGLCRSCYDRQGRDVRRGKTTWAALEKAGKTKPAAPRGRAWRAFKLRPSRGDTR